MSTADEMKEVQQVVATPAALALIARVRAQHGALMFYQSGGCCDGSAPMCYGRGELLVSDGDRLLGHVDGEPFYINEALFEYWSGSQLILDAEPGRGGMFSLEGATGQHFVSRARLYEDAEWRWLEANGKV
ncbi:DUF779 domain-containing protein [uncultured Azohydromonas sp.]|jgi:Uncharacterized protein conserved in bacteria|uniref:DUF779 domain-containing protein n=1 Tax=uncultured Azohydromonas sp. TaxID=487342 RepID=UPI0026086C10|nr:DUF779 domain-containing protein [uncultured Azohydromonas sp.]